MTCIYLTQVYTSLGDNLSYFKIEPFFFNLALLITAFDMESEKTETDLMIFQKLLVFPK